MFVLLKRINIACVIKEMEKAKNEDWWRAASRHAGMQVWKFQLLIEPQLTI
jgi:hypothetical protein